MKTVILTMNDCEELERTLYQHVAKLRSFGYDIITSANGEYIMSLTQFDNVFVVADVLNRVVEIPPHDNARNGLLPFLVIKEY